VSVYVCVCVCLCVCVFTDRTRAHLLICVHTPAGAYTHILAGALCGLPLQFSFAYPMAGLDTQPLHTSYYIYYLHSLCRETCLVQ
jgi:hypothetical protein